jgi:hypothetical protein
MWHEWEGGVGGRGGGGGECIKDIGGENRKQEITRKKKT